MKGRLTITVYVVLLLCCINVQAQNFAIGNSVTTFVDVARNNRNIDVELFYPADAVGTNVPVTNTPGVFPVLVFGHGFVMTYTAYQNIWEHLVPHGYIMVMVNTETGFSPSHTEFAKDLAYAVTAMQALHTNPASLFFGRIDTSSAVMGHSMGAGSSLLAVQYNPSITAVCNLAAAETNPSAIAACATIPIPSFIVAGENDCITPVGTNQQLMYSALASSCKTMLTVKGASHCQFANYNFNCSFGELTCSLAPTISRGYQQSITNQYILPWLDFELKGSCAAAQILQSMLDTATNVSYQSTCSFCPTYLSHTIANELKCGVFNGTVFVDYHLSEQFHVQIFSIDGRQIFSKQLMVSKHTPVCQMSTPGTYIITVSNTKNTFQRKLMVTTQSMW